MNCVPNRRKLFKWLRTILKPTKRRIPLECKTSFGKTLSVYDLCKAMNARSVLIVTNRPAIANSWYEDYKKFMGSESGYLFVSSTESLKGKPYVISREEYLTYNRSQSKTENKNAV